MSATKMSLKLTENWGGLYEALETCEPSVDETSEKDNIPDNLKILKEKLKVLEECKNLKEIQHALHFTIEDRNYLNSPLLDEIFDTIFDKNPLEEALENRKENVASFYVKRGLEISNKFFRDFVYGDITTTYDSVVEAVNYKLKYLQRVNINIDTKEFRKISSYWRPG